MKGIVANIIADRIAPEIKPNVKTILFMTTLLSDLEKLAAQSTFRGLDCRHTFG